MKPTLVWLLPADPGAHPEHPIAPGGGGGGDDPHPEHPITLPPFIPPPGGIWPPKPGIWPPELPPSWPKPPADVWPPVFPPRPEHPIVLPPGTLHPPLPPNYQGGKVLALILIPAEGWHWAILDTSGGTPAPQPPQPTPTGPPR